MKQKAIILLSGGLDSAVSLAYSLDQGKQCSALFFDYGQRNFQEIHGAKRIAEYYKVPFDILQVSFPKENVSPLIAENPNTLPARTHEEVSKQGQLSPAYVPARNTVFLAHALSYAETHHATEVTLSANAEDHSFPDCLPPYLEAMRAVFQNGGASYPIELTYPLYNYDKAMIIQLGKKLKMPLELTLSCYDPTAYPEHCGRCDACVLRKEGFKRAHVEDPTRYLAHTHI